MDYGAGNLYSVTRAFEHCGADVILTDIPQKIERAERLVLPGVGAFENGMASLTQRCLIDPIRDFALHDRPFLGICLGMQMMLETSEEFGVHRGFGFIPGCVTAIPTTTADGRAHKIPHIGWKPLRSVAGTGWNNTILNGLEPAIK